MKTYRIDDKEYNMITSIYEFKQFVTEGLIITHDIDTTINLMKRNHDLFTYPALIKKQPPNEINITIHKNISLDAILNINNDMINLYGWFPCLYIFMYYDNDELKIYNGQDFTIIKDNIDYLYDLEIIYEAKYDISVKFNANDKIYHLSPQLYRDKILKQGLIPKSKNRLTLHPERIYFLKDRIYSDVLLKNLQLTDKNKAIKYKNIIDKIFMNDDDTFKYDLYEISNLDKYKFYSDPNYGNGVYSIENINPKDIKLIENENI